MEGIIPMVYRSLKKSKTRRQYECLSSGAAHTYNIADFYIKEDDHHYFSRSKDQEKDVSGVHGAHHRRSNSVHIVGDDNGTATKAKQLVRFRSHRMFSCVTGTA